MNPKSQCASVDVEQMVETIGWLKEEVKTLKQARRMRFTIRAVVLLSILVLIGVATAGGVPQNPLVYSGYLEEGGKPVSGSKQVGVAIYDKPNKGTSLCSSNPAPVTFVKGRFKVALPSSCIVVIRSKTELWMELAVGGKPLSRQKISASAFALSTGVQMSCQTREVSKSAQDLIKVGGSIRVNCDPGETMTGGGISEDTGGISVTRSHPESGNDNAWICRFGGSSANLYTCFVRCCKLVHK